MMGHHRSTDYGSPGLPSPPESSAPSQRTPRRPVVKKPLNAFMLFMKEMRQKVIDECTLKESAAINQILGRKVTSSFRSILKIQLSKTFIPICHNVPMFICHRKCSFAHIACRKKWNKSLLCVSRSEMKEKRKWVDAFSTNDVTITSFM